MQGYEFFPDIPALQSKTMVTDVNIINNLNGIVVRNMDSLANRHFLDFI